GLRYLEFFEFRLVREALQERETLLQAMPHISWPMRFVLPLDPSMRFDSETPTSRIMAVIMPWAKGRRPAWLIRLGLFLYDKLGGRKILPGTTSLKLQGTPEGAPLKPHLKRAFEYSDCWVEDSRLVALNARDAADRGATVLTRCKVISARRDDDHWRIDVEDRTTGEVGVYRARMLINAGGPWVGHLIRNVAGINSRENVRLVRGSHIVTRKLFDHDKSYFFQGPDGRIIFAIPYETDFTLIGTTDADHPDASQDPICTPEERDYLLGFASRYFARDITQDDIVWTYSGVRPLYDDGATSATAATRDYVLSLDTAGAPMLNVFGGKITTYRRLAESAMDHIARQFDNLPGRWTAGVALPGGNFPVDGVPMLITQLQSAHGFLDEPWARRLVKAYGTDAAHILSGAESREDLGQYFGATLTEREVTWLMTHEFALRADDVVWRRTKLGLRMTAEEIAALDDWMTQQNAAREAAQ
ncbi:MAG: glycerol-3-phosphate dehydrogenase, partial [Pseudomonadota bacterium]